MRAAIFLLAIAPSVALAGNLATCILDKMPEVQNDFAAEAVLQLCNKKYPGGINAVKQGSGRGMLSFDSGAECAVKKGADTPSRRAGQLIYIACSKLYDEDGPWLKYK